MSPAVTSIDPTERLSELMRDFRLTAMAPELVPRLEAAGHEDCLPVLAEIFEIESEVRWHRKVTRLRRASKLPAAKTFDTFDDTRLPRPLARKLRELAKGDFLDRAVNVLPGTGKTHAACALAHALLDGGHSVLFTPTFRLVQDLLAAKRELDLPRALRKLDRFELLVLDDIGYVQQSREEMEVLFTLLAERYERRSLLVTSNLVFSHWDRIFQNPMTTAAAIDRLVHHSEILEFDVPSYRTQKRKATGKKQTPKSSRSNKEAR
jgi:DNA replication protein DnaC